MTCFVRRRVHVSCDAVFLFTASDWLSVTMETSAPLIEMDSSVIDKGTEEQLVRHFLYTYLHMFSSNY